MPLRVLDSQATYEFNSRIKRIVDTEDQFVFRIVLLAMAAQGLPDVRVNTLERLQDGHGKKRTGTSKRAAGISFQTQKTGDAEYGENVKTEVRKSAQSTDEFEG